MWRLYFMPVTASIHAIKNLLHIINIALSFFKVLEILIHFNHLRKDSAEASQRWDDSCQRKFCQSHSCKLQLNADASSLLPPNINLLAVIVLFAFTFSNILIYKHRCIQYAKLVMISYVIQWDETGIHIWMFNANGFTQ